MHPLIKQKLDELTQICARHEVRELELFGSAADGQFDPAKSDLDFLVEFLPAKSGRYADCYFGLLEDLQDLFGVPIDLIETRAIKNPYFLEGIAASRTVVYAA